MQLVLEARGHNADHAFVKVGVEDADRGRWLLVFVEQGLGNQKRLLAHTAFDLAAFAVDAVQGLGQLVRARGVVGQQAFNAQRHVRQAPGRVNARPQRKAEIERGRNRGIAPGRHK